MARGGVVLCKEVHLPPVEVDLSSFARQPAPREEVSSTDAVVEDGKA